MACAAIKKFAKLIFQDFLKTINHRCPPAILHPGSGLGNKNSEPRCTPGTRQIEEVFAPEHGEGSTGPGDRTVVMHHHIKKKTKKKRDQHHLIGCCIALCLNISYRDVFRELYLT